MKKKIVDLSLSKISSTPKLFLKVFYVRNSFSKIFSIFLLGKKKEENFPSKKLTSIHQFEVIKILEKMF